MTLEQVEFEFPDEKEAKANARKGGSVVEVEDQIEVVEADKPEIEVVDDTPEKDRGREPMKTPPPENLSDDELEKYDLSVRSRIKQVQKGYHEERRAKEAAQREREEALRLAQQLVEENKKLKGTLSEASLLTLSRPNWSLQTTSKKPVAPTKLPTRPVIRMHWWPPKKN